MSVPGPVGAGGRRLGRDFYARGSVGLARALLGCVIARVVPGGGVVRAVIVETEAYRGPADQGSHARNGLRTRRNETMYGPPGRLYVYFTYGMHHCANVVCAREGVPEAVLLRAAWVMEGTGLVQLERARAGLGQLRHNRDLLRGPGRLCAGLGIARRDDGEDLTSSERLWIVGRAGAGAVGAGAGSAGAGDAGGIGRVLRGPRIGLSARAGAWADRPLRYWIAGHPAVSGPRRGNTG